MKQTEPPSCRSHLVLIGKNRRGSWVAREQTGLFGGLFVSRAEAVKYALFENGHHPEAIVATSKTFELDMSNRTVSPDSESAPTDGFAQLKVA